MASSKKIGFFWGEDKITVVEFDKNMPLKLASSPLATKSATPSPFSSSLTEEIQITAILQKLLQDNQITGNSFYVSLPMKEIILRSFIIPYVKHEEIQNVIKFEVKKYIPFEIQDLAFVFHAIPFMEDQTKRLQVIFFAARKEVLARYDRILKQLNAQVSYCEPYMVSLSKALLFKKEIKATDHLAFLILDKNLGRICFIDKGIPQFIREFPLNASSDSEDTKNSLEALTLKIVNEVGNSFDFYTRQFSGDRIDQMLVSSDFVQPDLLKVLETEIKVKITRFSPVVIAGMGGQTNDLDAIYAMGACVLPPMDSLSGFNFLGGKAPKAPIGGDVVNILKGYKEVMLVGVICVALLVSVFFFFQAQLQLVQKQYAQAISKQGPYLNTPVESIQVELQENTDKLAEYKKIRLNSNLVFVLLKVASHIPQGALLNQFNISYGQGDSLTIDMHGDILKADPNEGIAVVNQIFTDLKNDKDLGRLVKNVTMASLKLEELNGQSTTGFNIHCY